jgi:membrane protease YdiL (CAAX protease family)
MDEPALTEQPAPGAPAGSPDGRPWELAVEPPEGDPGRSPRTAWPWWSAFVALVGALVLAAIGGLLVDLPALALGVKVTAEHTPPGLALADTFVQDLAFVIVPVYCAHLGGRAVRAWQLGLRAPAAGWRSAAGMILLLLVVFIVLSVAWAEVFNPEKEKLLEQLGTNETALLLVLGAGLTCVVAPVCEEILFRGYIFTALRNRGGTWVAAGVTALLFGGVHAGSAPVLDLFPLAVLGFGLCLLYRYSGSLYPCIVAHSINNSIAFSSLENWGWQAPVLLVGALLALSALMRLSRRLGLSGSGILLARSGA